jgi:hypothetical protein
MITQISNYIYKKACITDNAPPTGKQALSLPDETRENTGYCCAYCGVAAFSVPATGVYAIVFPYHHYSRHYFILYLLAVLFILYGHLLYPQLFIAAPV